MQTSLQINTTLVSKTETSPQNHTERRTAIVIDTDSLLHRGTNKKTGRARPQRSFNYFALAAALREQRVCDGSFCRNRNFPARAEHMIQAMGLKPIAVHENVDRVAMLEAIEYAFAGFERVILVTHDGDYLNVMRTIQACGIAVEVWGLRECASKKLTQAADRVVWIDDLMLPPSDLPGRIGPFGVIREPSLSQAT